MKYQVMRDLTETEYAELKQSIIDNGVLSAIDCDENGNILDGHHRKRICDELGVTDIPTRVRAGLTEQEKLNFAYEVNAARRQLTPEEKREGAKKRLLENPELSDRQIAKQVGASQPFVSAIRKEMEQNDEVITVITSKGADGKVYPRQTQNNAPVITDGGFDGEDDEDESEEEYNDPTCDPMWQQGETWDTLEEFAERFPDRLRELADEYSPKQEENTEQITAGAEPKEAIAKKPHIAQNSGNNEWYTPKEYIKAAVEVMGEIDLDPASNEIANEVVKAKAYYSIDDDGLKQDWCGRVWLNPPYAGELIPLFIDKLKHHVQNGDVTEAIALVNNATEVAWFNALISIASAVVFPKGRVKFYMPDGSTGAPLQGQCVLYCGNNPEAFMRVFKEFGWGARLNE